MKILILLLFLVPFHAFAGLPPIVLPSGTTYKYIPSGMKAAGVVATDSSGVASVVAPSTSGNVLTSNGTAWVSSPLAVTLSVATKTANYAMANTDDVIICNSSSPITITMQAASTATKKMYYVKNINTGSCTISSSDLIDGLSTLVVSTQWAGVQLTTDGTTWYGF